MIDFIVGCVVGIMVFSGLAWLALYRHDYGLPHEEWAARRRAERTPPCSSCGHRVEVSGRAFCACPAYLDWYERVNCRRVDSVPAAEVRGTKRCKYEKGAGE